MASDHSESDVQQGDLQFLCEKWQKRLGLADWDVRVAFVALSAVAHNGIDGDIEVLAEMRRAKIDVVRLEERSNTAWARRENTLEYIVLHELLHLHFDAFDTKPGTSERLAEEQAVHAITMALLEGENH